MSEAPIIVTLSNTLLNTIHSTSDGSTDNINRFRTITPVITGEAVICNGGQRLEQSWDLSVPDGTLAEDIGPYRNLPRITSVLSASATPGSLNGDATSRVLTAPTYSLDPLGGANKRPQAHNGVVEFVSVSPKTYFPSPSDTDKDNGILAAVCPAVPTETEWAFMSLPTHILLAVGEFVSIGTEFLHPTRAVPNPDRYNYSPLATGGTLRGGPLNQRRVGLSNAVVSNTTYQNSILVDTITGEKFHAQFGADTGGQRRHPVRWNPRGKARWWRCDATGYIGYCGIGLYFYRNGTTVGVLHSTTTSFTKISSILNGTGTYSSTEAAYWECDYDFTGVTVPDDATGWYISVVNLSPPPSSFSLSDFVDLGDGSRMRIPPPPFWTSDAVPGCVAVPGTWWTLP